MRLACRETDLDVECGSQNSFYYIREPAGV